MKKSTRKTRKQTVVHLPRALIAIVNSIGEPYENRRETLAAAIRAARADLLAGDRDASQIHGFIDRVAESGPYKSAIRAAAQADAEVGDLHNAYGTPALLAASRWRI